MDTLVTFDKSLKDLDEYRLWEYYRNCSNLQRRIVVHLIRGEHYDMLENIIGNTVLKWHIFIAANEDKPIIFEKLLKKWRNETPIPKDTSNIVQYLANTGNLLFFKYIEEIDKDRYEHILKTTASKMAEQIGGDKDLDNRYYEIIVYLLDRGTNPMTIRKIDRETVVDYFIQNGNKETFEKIRPITIKTFDKETFIDKIWKYMTYP